MTSQVGHMFRSFTDGLIRAFQVWMGELIFVFCFVPYISLHHTGLTHKLSKLSAVIQEHKQKYKASLESSQADNTLVSKENIVLR